MKLKKFNEHSNNIKQLSINDLSLWLRIDYQIKVNDRYGDTTYIIRSITEDGITAENKYGTRSFKFSELNGLGEEAWEIFKINDDEVFIN
jgi:hypothetical protein